MPQGFRLFLTLLLAVGAMPALGQPVFFGSVTDAETSEPLPAATLQLEGTLQGTITNQEGSYTLRPAELPAVLIVRYIGYATERRTLTAESEEQQDFALQPVAYPLEEVVVTGEDPAVAIMRQVIRRKQQWRKDLATFTATAYNRFTLSNDTGIVSISESLSEVFWDRERGVKEIVKAQRKTSNVPFDAFLPAALFVSNLYDDDIELSGYTFIGVTHPEALEHYRFRLQGVRYLDDQIVYDISVEPGNRLKTAFVGRVSVLGGIYALLEVALQPSEAFLFPPPIERYDVTYRQQFSNFGRAFWLPVDFRSDIDLKISFQGLLAFPTIRVRQVSRLTDYSINVLLPDSLYEDKEYLAVDSAAVRADTLLDRRGIAVPLEAREAQAYEVIDSTMTLEKVYAPEGLLARFVRARSSDDEEGQRNGNRRNILGLQFQPSVWFNRVEAFHGEASLSRAFGTLHVETTGGYSSGLEGRDRWTYGGGAALRFRGRGSSVLEASFHTGVHPRYASALYTRPMTSVYLLLGGASYFDYYWRTMLRVGASSGIRPLDTRFLLAWQVESPRALPATTGYNLLGQTEKMRSNPSVSSSNVASVTARVTMGRTEQAIGFIGGRQATLEVERGRVEDADDARFFTRYSASIDWRLSTFFRRRLLPNALDLRLSAATHTGALPFQRYGIVEARLGPYGPFGSLRTLTGRPYEGDRHLALFWEHNFRTIPFEALGLYGAARRGYSLIVHGGHAATWVSQNDYGGARFPAYVSGGFHHELGVSLSGVLGLFRIDLTTRLDEPALTLGFGAARLF